MTKKLTGNITSRYFEASNRLRPGGKKKRRIIAYVESYDDVFFWRNVFQEFENDEREFEVMLPESQLEGFIKKNKELRQLSYRTLIHKHFFENIDDRFPYQQLTLKQIGIPLYDVLKVSTENGVFYVELSADAY